MTTEIRFDPDLIRRYDIAGPRYTSYPTAVQFHEGFDTIAYRRAAATSNSELIPRALSLYVHLPFCHSLCYYCGCTKKVTRHPEHGRAYLKRLETEIALQGELYDSDRGVQQLHLGGGTPTFFDDEQLVRMMAVLGRHFGLLEEGGQHSVELDPRTMDAERLGCLAELGFNRFSLGIQDFDPDVQRAVNRRQSEEETLGLLAEAKRLGAHAVSVDLIYGLPLQTPDRFERTLRTVMEARPDRLSVYNYAHLPGLFRAQRLIREEDLPSPETKLEILGQTIETLTGAGYRYIGMDHFALPEDELSLAQDNGTLQRNFQGYSTHGNCDLVGLGVSSIGQVGDCYVQNRKDIPGWSSELDQGRLPVWRGFALSTEDRLRRLVIGEIMCHGRLAFADIEQRFGIDFADYFARELQALEQQAEDGLVDLDEDGLTVTPSGRLLLRHVGMAFDAYLAPREESSRFSRVI